MKQIDNISEIEEGILVSIDNGQELFNGYILEVISSDYGIMTVIISHDGDFEERVFDISFDEEDESIIDPSIFLL